jgi:hypothetical protein
MLAIIMAMFNGLYALSAPARRQGNRFSEQLMNNRQKS